MPNTFTNQKKSAENTQGVAQQHKDETAKKIAGITRIIAAITRKFDKTLATSIQNELFTAKKVNDLSTKDLTHLLIYVENMRPADGLTAEQFKTKIAELARPGIYVEKKLEEIVINNPALQKTTVELIQEIRAKNERVEQRQQMLEAKIQALEIQLIPTPQTTDAKSTTIKTKSPSKWDEFAKRQKRAAEDQPSSAGKRVRQQLNFTEKLDTSDEDAIDESRTSDTPDIKGFSSSN
jgi:hypothetical protein